MILTILNRELDRVGDIDDAISVIWDKHYREEGYVEIYTTDTSRSVELLQEGFYITRDDDEHVARIYSIATDTNEDEGDVIIASAKFAHVVLGQRIIWNTTNAEGSAEKAARALITDNCLSPTDRLGNPMRERIIQELELEEEQGLEGVIAPYQISYANLRTHLLEICATFHYGLRATIKAGKKKIAIGLYKGVDRSYRQTARPHVVFSQENENLLGFSYKHDSSTTINAALVGGEGEGAQRVLASVGSSSGIDRHEVFVDAKDITSEQDGGSTYTSDEYNALLETRGLLSMSPAQESFDASVDMSRSYEYRKDFDVGDIVTLHDMRTGAYVNVRLMSMLESEDANGYTLTPTFAVDF